MEFPPDRRPVVVFVVAFYPGLHEASIGTAFGRV